MRVSSSTVPDLLRGTFRSALTCKSIRKRLRMNISSLSLHRWDTKHFAESHELLWKRGGGCATHKNSLASQLLLRQGLDRFLVSHDSLILSSLLRDRNDCTTHEGRIEDLAKVGKMQILKLGPAVSQNRSPCQYFMLKTAILYAKR